MPKFSFSEQSTLSIAFSNISDTANGLNFEAFITPYQYRVFGQKFHIYSYIKLYNSNFEIADFNDYYGDAELAVQFDVIISVDLEELLSLINDSKQLQEFSDYSLEFNAAPLIDNLEIVANEGKKPDKELMSMVNNYIRDCSDDLALWIGDSELYLERIEYMNDIKMI